MPVDQVDKKQVKREGCAEYVEYFTTEDAPKGDEWESPLERKARNRARNSAKSYVTL